MDGTIRVDAVAAAELVCDAVVEQSVEADFTIPDYRPEIFKIIKTVAEPVVVQRLAVGTRATVEGYVKLTVVYRTADDTRLYAAMQKLPFSKQLDMKEPVGEDCIVLCDAGISYLNCRAVNSRRIDARGAVSLGVKVLSRTGAEVVSDVGEGVHGCRSEVSFVRLTTQNEKQFTISEGLAVDAEGCEEISILRCDIAAVVSSTELHAGRAIVAGAVTVTLAVDISEGEDCRVRRFVYNLPFQQLVELEAGDETAPVARVSVISCTAEPAPGGIIDISAACAVEVYALREDKVTLISDVFSTACEMESDVRTVSLLAGAQMVNEPFLVSATLEKPAGRLVDYSLTGGAPHIVPDADGTAVLAGTATLSCIVCGEDGDLQSFERSVEYTVSAGQLAVRGNVMSMLESLFHSVDCTSTDSMVTLRAEGTVSGIAVDQLRLPAVTSVRVQADHKKETGRAAMSIYYADPGEDVWSIAKAFNTAPYAVAAVNGIAEDEMLSVRTMLVVPIVN